MNFGSVKKFLQRGRNETDGAGGRSPQTQSPPSSFGAEGPKSGKGRLVTRSHWQRDEEARECSRVGCGMTFKFASLEKRRSHCRRCGRIFCHSCVSFSRRLDSDANPDPEGTWEKVCEACFSDGRAQGLGATRDRFGLFSETRGRHSDKRNAAMHAILCAVARLSVLPFRSDGADPFGASPERNAKNFNQGTPLKGPNEPGNAAVPWAPDADRCSLCTGVFSVLPRLSLSLGFGFGAFRSKNAAAGNSDGAGSSDAFSLGKKRHHCRVCGRVVCGACSKGTLPLGVGPLFPSEERLLSFLHDVVLAERNFNSSFTTTKSSNSSNSNNNSNNNKISFSNDDNAEGRFSITRGGVRVRICTACEAHISHSERDAREIEKRRVAAEIVPSAKIAALVFSLSQRLERASVAIAVLEKGSIEEKGAQGSISSHPNPPPLTTVDAARVCRESFAGFAEEFRLAMSMSKNVARDTYSKDFMAKALLAKLAWLSSERFVPLRNRFDALLKKIIRD